MTLNTQFIRQIEQLFPCESKQLLDAITSTDAVTSIRINEAKTAAGWSPASCDRVPWCETGYYLDGHQPFTFDPLLHAGLYYVQDASSMIICHVVKSLVSRPVRYLDLCAAPGGKSTAAISMLSQGSLMVCNEVVPQRANILKENIMKWGCTDCIVTSDDSSRWGQLTHFFDVVAADVPCSGEGMFRKDPAAVEQWTPALVAQCAERQRLIIDNVWNAIAPGGLLIYSTCTYNREENESMVEYIEDKYGATPISLDLPAEWGICRGIGDKCGCYRFLPHRTRGEGLFLCVLKKPDDEPQKNMAYKRRSSRQATAKIPNDVKQWLADSDRYTFSSTGDTITATDKERADETEFIASKVKVLSRGIEIGSIKGKDIIPAQSLSLSTALDRQAFATAEISYNEAISFLRGDAITLENATRGIVLLQYRGTPIGFVKNLGNRANNLYPREWRIRSTYSPSVPPSILNPKGR